MKLFLLAYFVCIANVLASAQTTREDSLKKSLELYPKEDTIKVNLFYQFGSDPLLDNLENAAKEVQEGVKLAGKLNWGEGQAKGLELLAYLQNASQEFDLAIASGLNALKISEGLNDSLLMASVSLILGQNYLQWGNDSLGKYHLKKALEIANKIKNKKVILLTTAVLGDYYCDHHLWDEAAKYVNDALKNSIEQREENLEAHVLVSIADKQYYEHNYTKGIEYLHRALVLESHQKSYHGVAFSYVYISRGFCYLKNRDSAYYYANAALQLSKKHGLVKELSDSYEVLFTVATTFHNYRTALVYRKIFDSLQSKTHNMEAAQRIERAIIKADQDKKDAESKAEQEIKDADTKRIRNLQYSAIGAFFVVAILLFWNNRQKQKAKTKIQNAYISLKSAQAQLIQQEKMASLGELTAGIAHEIQNPLNFVNNFSEVNDELISDLKTELQSGNLEEVSNLANTIQDNERKIIQHGKRADGIVKGMLLHSRTGASERVRADINAIVDECLKLTYHNMRAKDKSFEVQIHTDYDQSIGKFQFVPHDMVRVFVNLFNNAFYALGERKKQNDVGYEPTLWVSTRRDGATVNISIKDNGVGISANFVDKIFQPFFTTKPAGQGIGLGLSLSYDIIKAHGGSIKVDSIEGSWSEFTIELPIGESK